MCLDFLQVLGVVVWHIPSVLTNLLARRILA
jgi:hypothetical protein